MSTRCVIRVDGVEFMELYKHYDGYPEATLEWLEDFNKEFEKERAHDPNYKMAQLIRSSIRDAEKYGLDDSKFTGWGVLEFGQDCWAGYEYTLKNDGTVEVKDNYDE